MAFMFTGMWRALWTPLIVLGVLIASEIVWYKFRRSGRD